jgi:hypothetical protein
VLLHAACVVENGRAILIPGKEGRGKTTLSRNLPGVAVVNDDLSLVLLDPASGRFCAYRVPDPENLDGKTPFAWEGPWPLSTIVFPRRERPRGIYRLTPQEAFTHGTEEGPAFLDADGFLEFHSAHKLYNRFMKRLFGGTACVSVSYRPGEDSDLLARLLEGEEYR